jgi:hypothetical protein
MQTDVFGSIIWFILLMAMFMFYPRLMLSQLIFKIEQSARKMEAMSRKANLLTARKADKNLTKELKNKIDEFTDFFVVEPSNIDPYGLVRKIDQTIRAMENRFDEFVNTLAAKKDYKERQELNYGLRAAIGLRQISKIVRHNVELAKKFKNLQIAMMIQMQLPIIEKIAESEFKGTEAFLNGWPIGDGIGSLAAASLLDNSKDISEGIVYGETYIDGRKCFVLKAKGPEPHLGRIDEAIEKIMSRNKISRFITIDASQKLEGEKTGSVAEGVGFAMGGIGQREMIENMLLPKKKPIDSVIIKVGMEDAITPMKKEIFKSLPKIEEAIKRAVSRAKKNEKVMIIGVGNSCGIGDNKKEIASLDEIIEKLSKKEEKRKEKKGGGWF